MGNRIAHREFNDSPPGGRWNPETTPDYAHDPIYPAHFGFEEKGLQRTERKMYATKEEMIAAKVPFKYRDFCVHKYIQFKSCARAVAPFPYKCHHEKHEYEACMADDYTISMKEYERERRLMVRAARKNRLVKLKQERLDYLSKFASHSDHEGAAAE